MLAATNVTKSYNGRIVLSDVSFELDPGSVSALIGPNGSGKSTLLHIATGLVRADHGEFVCADVLAGSSLYPRTIGFCADDLPQPDLLTGEEYLDLIKSIRRLKSHPTAENELLHGMRLFDSRKRLLGTYSHGMKRKLQVIAALLHAPQVLILDEPFRGLDPESSAIIKTLLLRLAADGCTILVSTHDLLVAQQMCDRVLVLSAGQMLLDANMDDLKAKGGPSLEETFLSMTGLAATAASSADTFFSGLSKVTDRGRG